MAAKQVVADNDATYQTQETVTDDMIITDEEEEESAATIEQQQTASCSSPTAFVATEEEGEIKKTIQPPVKKTKKTTGTNATVKGKRGNLPMTNNRTTITTMVLLKVPWVRVFFFPS